MAFIIKTPYVVATHGKKFSALSSLKNKSKAFAFGMVSGIVYFNNGTTNLPLGASNPFNTYAADAAITVSPQVAYLTKGSAGAYTVAAPGAAGIGMVLVLTTGTDFAHVVTFTGSTLFDGTTGA